jgi:hypothetical protein
MFSAISLAVFFFVPPPMFEENLTKEKQVELLTAAGLLLVEHVIYLEAKFIVALPY